MVYTYDDKTRKLKPVSVPRLRGEDANRVQNAKVPKAFLKKVMGIKLNIERA